MVRPIRKKLRQEVQELTDLLRYNKDWVELRAAIEKKGLALENLLLVGFMEDESGNEWGLIITDELKIFDYKRKSSNNFFLKWHLVNASEIPNLSEKVYAAADTGYQMAKAMKVRKNDLKEKSKRK